jgi:hypothetical protein
MLTVAAAAEELWAELRKVTGSSKERVKFRDLFADWRCSQPILFFLSTTGVGKRLPKPAVEDEQSQSPGQTEGIVGGDGERD